MNIECPGYVTTAFRLLEESGFTAYAVGGCIRDSIMGKEPNDWDMTTPSTPEETMKVFNSFRVIPTGIKHGTVTVIIDGQPLEITTMRIDGEYHDNRRPDNVKFTTEIEQDLSRRDFTVNAMAYNPETGLVDPFNGRKDIEDNIIRCVGNPDRRFQEDALRIIRGLRFASVLNFKIDCETSKSIILNKHLLGNVAVERIRVELVKLLQGCGIEAILEEYKDIFFDIIPELKALDGFPQNTPFHIYDVWGHTIKVVSGVKNTPELRVAALLHDIAKPLKYYSDENGIAHFKGHPELSSEMALEILKRLRFSNAETDKICKIITLHDTRPNGDRNRIAKLCSEYSPEIVKLTLELMRGDASGKKPEYYDEDIKSYELAEKQIQEIQEKNLCLNITDLDVNGRDIMELGYHGQDIGIILEQLLTLVIDEKADNKKDILLNIAKNLK